jgi:hypothetical protein
MRNLKYLAVSLVLMMGVSSFAEPNINGKEHPRRKEVVKRAEKEKDKNNAAAVDSKITDAQAKKLDRQDNRIVKQEQADAAKNGGHITKKEQRQLNREESHVNHERHTMEKKDAASAPSAPAATPAPAPVAPTTPSSN